MTQGLENLMKLRLLLCLALVACLLASCSGKSLRDPGRPPLGLRN